MQNAPTLLQGRFNTIELEYSYAVSKPTYLVPYRE